MNDPGKTLDEHFWFTATTVGVNAFLMSSAIQPKYGAIVIGLSTVVSVYAIFLIVHRSAIHAGKVKLPQDLKELPESEKTATHKARETWHHMRIVPRHLVFVVCEMSGALFYLILVMTSCIGVWLAR